MAKHQLEQVFDGALSSPRTRIFYSRSTVAGTIERIDLYADQAAGTAATFLVKKNGATIQTLVFTAGEAAKSATGLSIAVADADVLTVDASSVAGLFAVPLVVRFSVDDGAPAAAASAFDGISHQFLIDDANVAAFYSGSSFDSSVDSSEIAEWTDLSGNGNHAVSGSTPKAIVSHSSFGRATGVKFRQGVEAHFVTNNFSFHQIFVIARVTDAFFPSYNGMVTSNGTDGADVVFVGFVNQSFWYKDGSEPSQSAVYRRDNVQISGARDAAPQKFHLYELQSVNVDWTKGLVIGRDRQTTSGRHFAGEILDIICLAANATDELRAKILRYASKRTGFDLLA